MNETYYHTTHYALKVFFNDYLPVESNVETKFIKIKITPDKTAAFSPKLCMVVYN